jgi:hypothetical protein
MAKTYKEHVSYPLNTFNDKTHDTEYKAVCLRSDGYRGKLTEGKVYDITIGEGIFENEPYAYLIGDNGKKTACYLRLFRNADINTDDFVC